MYALIGIFYCLHARIQELSSGGGGGPGQSDKKKR